MARATNFLTFGGIYDSNVLGTFKIMRGFASLKELADISVPYEMEDGNAAGLVKGLQRKLVPSHAESIRRYLENGEQRFIPEVILSIRTKVFTSGTEPDWGESNWSRTTEGLAFYRTSKDRSRVHSVRVNKLMLDQIRGKKLIRRVDGNHRLALAADLKDDPHLSSKYLAPFCFIFLGPPGDEADDYTESLIFHTINSTAMPLESEHALRLILGQNPAFDMRPEQEFAFSPDLYFTRLLHQGLLRLSKPAQERLGSRALTYLHSAARSLRELEPKLPEDLSTLQKFAAEFLASLNDIVTRLEPREPGLCKAEFFIELVARIWKATPENESHNARVNSAVRYLEELATWLGRDGLTTLKEGQSISKQVIEIYNRIRARIPKRVFLARWYPTAKDGEENDKAKLRLQQIRAALHEIEKESGIYLKLVDMGTQTGGTFPIHPKMYEAIASSDIVLVDLTGVRPNVCVEAGFALRDHEKNRLIFIFQPTKANKTVPFDLNTFRYEPFKDTGEILGKIKPHIEAILRSAVS